VSVDDDIELDARVVAVQVTVEPGPECLVVSLLVGCCAAGGGKLGADSAVAPGLRSR
jgi:hypothetical protein